MFTDLAEVLIEGSIKTEQEFVKAGSGLLNHVFNDSTVAGAAQASRNMYDIPDFPFIPKGTSTGANTNLDLHRFIAQRPFIQIEINVHQKLAPNQNLNLINKLLA